MYTIFPECSKRSPEAPPPQQETGRPANRQRIAGFCARKKKTDRVNGQKRGAAEESPLRVPAARGPCGNHGPRALRRQDVARCNHRFFPAISNSVAMSDARHMSSAKGKAKSSDSCRAPANAAGQLGKLAISAIRRRSPNFPDRRRGCLLPGASKRSDVTTISFKLLIQSHRPDYFSENRTKYNLLWRRFLFETLKNGKIRLRSKNCTKETKSFCAT